MIVRIPSSVEIPFLSAIRSSQNTHHVCRFRSVITIPDEQAGDGICAVRSNFLDAYAFSDPDFMMIFDAASGGSYRSTASSAILLSAVSSSLRFDSISSLEVPFTIIG